MPNLFHRPRRVGCSVVIGETSPALAEISPVNPRLVIAMEAKKENQFQSFSRSVGRFGLHKKTVLIPEMNRIAAHLVAATLRGFGIQAKVLETYKRIDLGLEYTSGKECFPCQITLGDILYFVEKEKERLGEAFNPEDYLYFLPEAEGPCRFGMYNKYQRIVLDSFPGLDKLKIVSITSLDGYSFSGLLEGSQHQDFRKAGYLSLVIADLLDRLLWRIRPYEKEQGMADEFMEKSMHAMADILEAYGPKKKFDKALNKLEEIVEEGKGIINPHCGRGFCENACTGQPQFDPDPGRIRGGGGECLAHRMGQFCELCGIQKRHTWIPFERETAPPESRGGASQKDNWF